MIAKGEGWEGILEIPYKERNKKPREIGESMIIDKGLGLTEVKDMLEASSEYIDYLKLGFGTSALYGGDVLQKKINLVRSYNVDIYPGGTFLEIAVLQDKLSLYLERAKKLGFTCIEVSDGTIEMSLDTRERAIKEALDLGFKVLSEVGKKDSEDELENTKILEQIKFDLKCGVHKVIVEGRESGKGVVIYDKDGSLKEDDLDIIVKGIENPEKILWEAPLKSQQQELIKRFGPNVSLGNISPDDVLAVEALRVGLRGDTLKHYIKTKSVG